MLLAAGGLPVELNYLLKQACYPVGGSLQTIVQSAARLGLPLQGPCLWCSGAPCQPQPKLRQLQHLLHWMPRLPLLTCVRSTQQFRICRSGRSAALTLPPQ